MQIPTSRLLINSLFLTLFGLIITESDCFAQADSLFSRTWDSGGPDRGVAVITSSGGDYLVVGSTTNERGDLDVLLNQYASDGELSWSKSYGEADNENGWSIVESEKGYLIAGFVTRTGVNDILMLSVDRDGNELWLKTYGGAGDDLAWSIEPGPGGNYLLAAQTSSHGAGEVDALLMCINSEGDSLWSQTYGGAKTDRVFSLGVFENGNVALAGITYSYGEGDRDAWLVLTDSTGKLIWQKTYGGAGYDNAHHVIVNKEENMVLTGYGDHFGDFGHYDGYVKIINQSGNELSSQTFGSQMEDRILDVVESTSGGYVLTGFTKGFGSMGTDAWVIRADNTGEERWSKTFIKGRVNIGYSTVEDSEGNWILTGHTFTGNQTDSDLWLLKFKEIE